MIGELQLTTLPVLDTDEWSAISKICEILDVFDEVTQELSAEKVVTISKMLLLIDGIQDHLHSVEIDANNTAFNDVAKMIEILKNKFSSRSIKYGSSSIIAEATFLDPRFKKYGFPDVDLFVKTEREITELAGKHICYLVITIYIV